MDNKKEKDKTKKKKENKDKTEKKIKKELKKQEKLKKENRTKDPVQRDPDKSFRIIPLGGMKEIGKNMTLVEYENDIIIIDCGFAFPEHEMFGIDVVIPDFSYLRENLQNVKALIVTHGHEDHIGAIPFLLQVANIPIYASPLTVGLIESKLEEHDMAADFHTIRAGDVFRIGEFRIEAIRTNHSIPDALAFSIKCPAGHIVHTGDFKVDYAPLDGKMIDLARFSELGEEGVDVLLSDSTNARKPGFTPSERIVIDSMNRIFDEHDKRIIIATFSSNIYRIKNFMEASIKHGRKIAISGRSMEKVISLAIDLGYMNIPETAFVDISQIGNIPDGNLTIVTTGSQGEPMSALTRMVNDNHKAVKLKKGDVVVFSSSPIPGNEKTITGIVNKLYEKKVKVFQSDLVDIHVSGHACQEELKLMLSLVRPKFFVPAHGEYRHQIEHSNIARGLGMNKGNIFILSNGDSLRITGGKYAKHEEEYADGDDVLVDGYGIGDVGSVVLRDRKQLSEAGLVVISVAINHKTGELATQPELITRGFVYVKENASLIEEAVAISTQTVERCADSGEYSITTLKNALRDDMRDFIYRKTKRSPVILPVILYV